MLSASRLLPTCLDVASACPLAGFFDFLKKCDAVIYKCFTYMTVCIKQRFARKLVTRFSIKLIPKRLGDTTLIQKMRLAVFTN
jgi:hypothetical protein